jgi:hypothetical protein
MRLLRLGNVEIGPSDRVFCYSRPRALVIGLAWVTAILVLVVCAFDTHWKPGYYLATVLFLFLLLTRRFITARFRACEQNRNRCYTPEWLLKAWDLSVNNDLTGAA